MRRISSALSCALSLVLVLLPSSSISAQETGTVGGRVSLAADGEALSSVSVTVQSTGQTTVTGNDGTQAGDQLLPNTPSKKASLSITYAGQQGVDANVTVRLVDGYAWAAGVFQGHVPSNEFVNVGAGFRVNNYLRIHGMATNIFDEKRFQLYGGFVIDRRVLGGITATF